MNNLPDDLIWYIQKLIYNYNDLYNLKLTCKLYNKIISNISLSKLLVKNKFDKYKPTLYCININCYEDTEDIFEDVYYYGARKYIHFHQSALNKTSISINNISYSVSSPYCSECFIKYILIGDKENVTHNCIMNKVSIDYN